MRISQPAARQRRNLLVLSGATFMAVSGRAMTPGAPVEAVNAFIDVSAQLLGLSFDAGARQQMARFIDGYWLRRQAPQMSAVLGTRGFLAQLQAQPPELRAVALRLSRPAALLTLAKDAADGDELSAWLLARYHQMHPVLAPGRPGGLPLTRDTVDGQLDLAHFMATEIHRQPATRPSPQEREQAYRAAAARHPSLDARTQLALAQAPGEAARLRYGWQRASAADRLLGRAELGARLTPPEQAQLQQHLSGLNTQLQGLAAQQQGLLGSALAHLRQNSDTIMGRGTVWNPASGRWEQQGGIVTEYNGTVRVP
jgi:hypothetical protein